MSWFSDIEEDLLSHFQFSISALGCNLHSRKALLIAAMDSFVIVTRRQEICQ